MAAQKVKDSAQGLFRFLFISNAHGGQKLLFLLINGWLYVGKKAWGIPENSVSTFIKAVFYSLLALLAAKKQLLLAGKRSAYP